MQGKVHQKTRLSHFGLQEQYNIREEVLVAAMLVVALL